MRSITFVQALQFWLKFAALLMPAFVLLGGVAAPRRRRSAHGYPTALAATPSCGSTRAGHGAGAGGRDARRSHGTVDGRPVGGPTRLRAGEHRLGAGTEVDAATRRRRPGRSPSLPAQRNESWMRPLGSGQDHPLYASLSLILAICLGTMGLPHVLVRFYTNPDGRDTRRTTLVVIGPALGVLPAAHGVRRDSAAVRARSAAHRRHRRDRAAPARPDARRAGRRAARRAGHRRRVRGVPVDGVRADRVGGRRALAGRVRRRRAPDRTPGRPGPADPVVPARAPSPRSPCPTCSACRASTSAWPRSSGWRSRSRRPRSARCSCSGSGGRGSPRAGALAGLVVGGAARDQRRPRHDRRRRRGRLVRRAAGPAGGLGGSDHVRRDDRRCRSRPGAACRPTSDG